MDQKDGRLLAQGQEQVTPSVMENLLLCTVKLCDSSDADRNNCFQVHADTQSCKIRVGLLKPVQQIAAINYPALSDF